MANAIALAKRYIPMLDLVYMQGTLTSVLDAPAELVKETLNANEIMIPKMSLQGLGDYDRSTGAPSGDATFEWETKQFTQDRGRRFMIDAQDNAETLDLAFGKLAGEFIRTKVNPEVDAYRFAVLSAKAGTKVNANLDKTTALEAYDTAVQVLKDADAGMEGFINFISPTMEKYLKQSGLITRQFVTNIGQIALNREIPVIDGVPVIVVPQTRFYSAIATKDGKTAGEEVGGYVKDALGKNINFLLVDAKRVMGIKKSTLPAIFSPEENQTADAWMFRYRLYHDMIVPDNAESGIYVHTVA